MGSASSKEFPAQPATPDFGVQIKGNQKAEKESIENEVCENQFAEQPKGHVGVKVGGDQAAGGGIKNNVRGNVIGAPPPCNNTTCQ